MADTMQFDLVSPERKLTSVAAKEVRLPGIEGDLTIMPGHAPLITTLRPGLVTVVADNGKNADFAVTGGFAEINAESVSLLAERGHDKEEITQEIFNEMMADAYQKKKAAEKKAEQHNHAEEFVAGVVQILADLEALGTHIGMDPKQASVPE